MKNVKNVKKKVMSTKLQWMEETCIEEKESQETLNQLKNVELVLRVYVGL